LTARYTPRFSKSVKSNDNGNLCNVRNNHIETRKIFSVRPVLIREISKKFQSDPVGEIGFSPDPCSSLALSIVALPLLAVLPLLFFCLIWGSVFFIENLVFFDSGQISEMYVVLLYFPFKNTMVSQT